MLFENAFQIEGIILRRKCEMGEVPVLPIGEISHNAYRSLTRARANYDSQLLGKLRSVKEICGDWINTGEVYCNFMAFSKL